MYVGPRRDKSQRPQRFHDDACGLSFSRLWWPADLSAVAIRGAALTPSKEVQHDGTNPMRVLRIVSEL